MYINECLAKECTTTIGVCAEAIHTGTIQCKPKIMNGETIKVCVTLNDKFNNIVGPYEMKDNSYEQLSIVCTDNMTMNKINIKNH